MPCHLISDALELINEINTFFNVVIILYVCDTKVPNDFLQIHDVYYKCMKVNTNYYIYEQGSICEKNTVSIITTRSIQNIDIIYR